MTKKQCFMLDFVLQPALKLFINPRYKKILYVLLKALPPVCMKYTARDESRVANIAWGEAECYICHKTFINCCILSYKQSGGVLSVLLYFTLI